MFDTFYKMALLTAECQEVIGLRALKAARGGTDAAVEASLMMSEKIEAARLHGPAFFVGGTLDQMIDDYRAIVQANAVRLGAA